MPVLLLEVVHMQASKRNTPHESKHPSFWPLQPLLASYPCVWGSKMFPNLRLIYAPLVALKILAVLVGVGNDICILEALTSAQHLRSISLPSLLTCWLRAVFSISRRRALMRCNGLIAVIVLSMSHGCFRTSLGMPSRD